MNPLFERIGGRDAVNQAVEVFYEIVLKDGRIAHFFDDIDMETQKIKQKAFLTMAFGGPNKFTGQNLRDGHAHLVARGLDDSHFDAVLEDLGQALAQLGVPEELVAEVRAIAESTRGDVLGRAVPVS